MTTDGLPHQARVEASREIRRAESVAAEAVLDARRKAASALSEVHAELREVRARLPLMALIAFDEVHAELREVRARWILMDLIASDDH